MNSKNTPQVRIQRITIGRLYNLGNYEHIRYELTVEIPEGRKASIALRNTLKLLKAVNPKPPVPAYDYEHAKSVLSDPEAWHKNITNKIERKKLIRDMVKAAKRTIATFEKWAKRRHAAELVLDDIGGIKAWKDAKCDWQDDDDDY